MKPYFLLFILFLIVQSPPIGSANGAVVLVADAGYTDSPPQQYIDERVASLYIENASSVSWMWGKYDHPYDATDFAIVWQPGVDTQRSRVETTHESIQFTVYFTHPVSSNDYQNVFTAKPVQFSKYGIAEKHNWTHASHCTWIEAEAYNENGDSLTVETHTDPIWHETDNGVFFSVYVDGFPQPVDKIFLTAMDGTEFYPLHEMMSFEDFFTHETTYVIRGGIVVGISSYPYYPLSFTVQTVDGKRYEYNNLPRDVYFDKIRLVYSPSGVEMWESY